MNDDRVYLTAAALARAAGLDPRDKELKAIEPDAYLQSSRGKRIKLFVDAMVEVLKADKTNKTN
jgi:hypothetical protein